MNYTQIARCRPTHPRNARTHIHGRSACQTLAPRSQWFARARRKPASA